MAEGRKADQVGRFVEASCFRYCLKNLITEKCHESPPSSVVYSLIVRRLSGTAVLEVLPSLVHFLLEEGDQFFIAGLKEVLESSLRL